VFYQPAAEWGQWYWPIDQSVVDTADQYDSPFKQQLVQLVFSRINCSMTKDTHGVISKSRKSPQPSGRYYNAADLIGMWNRSCGFCPCGRPIYFSDETAWAFGHSPPDTCQATVQRLDPEIIHLRHNCADTLICLGCNGKTNFSSAHNSSDSSNHPCQ
jgi:NADH pyrophosphatase NudC (nudix superfamily)